MHLIATTNADTTRAPLRDATGRPAGVVRLEAALQAARATLPPPPPPRDVAGDTSDDGVAPTREQESVFEALALEHDLVMIERTPTRAHPQRREVSCITPGRAVVVYHVYASGLRCEA